MIKFIIERVVIIVSLLIFSSCASLYVGEDLPNVNDLELGKVNNTITFRIVYINLESSKDESYRVHGASGKTEEDYIILQDSFNKVEFDQFPYEYVWVKGEAALTKLLNDTRPKFKSDYFVDVLVTTPFLIHGIGMGMYGFLINAITLGIFPSYWIHNYKYQIKIYAKDKEYNHFELREKYHEFSSVLFNLVPGSDRKGSFYKLGSIDKNTFKTILIKIQEVITK